MQPQPVSEVGPVPPVVADRKQTDRQAVHQETPAQEAATVMRSVGSTLKCQLPLGDTHFLEPGRASLHCWEMK